MNIKVDLIHTSIRWWWYWVRKLNPHKVIFNIIDVLLSTQILVLMRLCAAWLPPVHLVPMLCVMEL